LEKTLPTLDPEKLTGLKYIGVDEVARAKAHVAGKELLKGSYYLLQKNSPIN